MRGPLHRLHTPFRWCLLLALLCGCPSADSDDTDDTALDVARRPDATQPDASQPDASRPDSSLSDTSQFDGGRSDGGRPDAVTQDTDEDVQDAPDGDLAATDADSGVDVANLDANCLDAVCDAAEHTLCEVVECGGVEYWCTELAEVWGWRERSNCDDGDLCTYGDVCDETGLCVAGDTLDCSDGPCLDRECDGSSVCVETVLTSGGCEDGNLCTYGDTCSAEGVCQPGSALSCDGRDTTCLSVACDGTSTCGETPINLGGSCDDGDPETDDDVCQADGTCLGTDGCPPPVESCTDGDQNRRGCGGARTIGRSGAGGTGGWTIWDDTCGARDDFEDSSSCWDANNDHSYRLYMREGESVTIRYETDEPCAFDEWSWNGTLKIFETGGCESTACGTKVYCEDNERDQTTTYVAPRDGWIIIVADGSHAFDDEGDYWLSVDLTCNDADCECP